MKWFQRRCYECGHAVQHPYWDGNVLVSHNLCALCQVIGYQRERDGWKSGLIDVNDLIELGLAPEDDGRLEDLYNYVSKGGIVIPDRVFFGKDRDEMVS